MSTDNPTAWLDSLKPLVRPWTWLCSLLGTVGALCIIAQAGLLAHIIHSAFMEDTPRDLLLPAFVVLAGVIVLRALIAWGREVSGQRASTMVRRQVRQQLLEHIGQLGPVHANDQRTAHLSSVAMERVEALHGFFSHYLPQKILAIIIPTVIIVVVFPVSWVVGSIFLVTAPLIPFFMVLIGKGAANLNQKNFQTLSRMSSHFLDTLQGLTTLKLFHRSRDEAENIAQSSEEYRRGTMTVLRVAFLSSAVLEFFTAVAIAMTAVYLGLNYLQYMDFGLYSRELTLQMGLFLLLLAPEFYQPLRELGTHYHARAEAVGAADGISTILNTPLPAWSTASNNIDVDTSHGVSLEFIGLEHAFALGQRPALQGVDLQVQAGEWLAVVGASGAGKTTLLNLLLGFLPLQQGQILVNAQPLYRMDPEAWRRHVAWVPQNPTLFHGTIAENMTLGQSHLSHSRLITAARDARVLDFSESLRGGLDAPVGEQGNLLSGGQARRVALARAFIKDAPLLLLDEPTAGLDGENESLIMESLQKLAVGRTVVMLTHRLKTARLATRIAVMESGRVVELGSHAELMNQQGYYFQLVNSGQEVLP
ncbi:heme ABC transporter permease/ATP-binding protein CydD [Desulfurispira natronophila]|uniref:ATP-binding cassette subfamily C protein CydD n=1 Tax=Desulfurispira natronophila TaxID=682562 RepID=A0A7W7Y3S3_9BACT|nr:cysteine/glutathione ABC transporter permease/ATP-binding protein CydD [Desulfurispira natronophila]MBB5021545.1 ATP-binding cassette subfamily C protein CydD [Desulfurispira natronophila]